MIFLIAALIATSMISIVMRISEPRTENNISVLAINYVTCTILALGMWSIRGAETGSGTVYTIGIGLFNGLCYLGGFALLQANIRRNGVVLPATFMKLGVLVPTIMAIVVFGEIPGKLQIAGMAVALAAILMINLGGSGAGTGLTVTWRLGLIFLLLVGGSGDAMSKVYEETGRAELSELFMLMTFISALILCTILAKKKGQHLTKAEVGFGMLLGIPNYFSSYLLLKSLSYLPAILVYPTYSIGAILIVSMVGVFAFREKLTRTQMTAVALIAVALVMLNI